MCFLFLIFRRLRGKHPEHVSKCTLFMAEFIRWIAIAIPFYLSLWLRDTQVKDITVSDDGLTSTLRADSKTRWLMMTGIFMAVSLVIYLPIKLLCFRCLKNARNKNEWRPSVLIYIIFCAIPCLVVTVISVHNDLQNNVDVRTTMGPYTAVVLQAVVMGLTVTEWMAKMSEKHMSYALSCSMVTDCFFAYDTIDFFMLAAIDHEIYHSLWLYVTFVFGFISMFKYIPHQPINLTEGTPRAAVIAIIVSMVCNDIPFLIIRAVTMFQYGLVVSDVIHPVKNVVMICLGLTQLCTPFDD